MVTSTPTSSPASSSVSSPTSPPALTSVSPPMVAIAVVVLGLLAAIAWQFLSRHPASNPSISPPPVTSPTTGTTPAAPVTDPSPPNASPN